MHIDIQSRGFELGASFQAQAYLRARVALGRHGQRIDRVVLILEDINGPRGGEDKRCLVQVVMMQGSAVLVEDRGEDLRSLIDRGLARAARSVARRLSRRTRPRYPSRRVAADSRPDPVG